MAEGNRHLVYKGGAQPLEQKSPGAKATSSSPSWSGATKRSPATPRTERVELTPCTVCGSPHRRGVRLLPYERAGRGQGEA